MKTHINSLTTNSDIWNLKKCKADRVKDISKKFNVVNKVKNVFQ